MILFRLIFILPFAVLALVTPGAHAAEPATSASYALNTCDQPGPIGTAVSAGGSAAGPLVVGPSSHVVVMEYEAWFGPRTGVVPQASVRTCLQSKDMQALGGGYDSTDPSVIAQHVAWLEQAGMDAVTLDVTNNVSCIFDGDNPDIIAKTCTNALFRAQNVQIKHQNFHLYSAWAALRTRLKLIPLLGGFDAYALTTDANDPRHRCALAKEIDAFGERMKAFPSLNVVYLGKPMMLIYLGTPVDPARVAAIRAMLRATGLERRYTFRLVGGYLESQPQFWASPGETPTGPIEIAPQDGFWSVGDRLNFWGAPPAPYFPTYSKQALRIENMTASLATAGQSGWTCAAGGTQSYCLDAALRYCGEGYQNGCKPGDYETFGEFMAYARSLRPIFLLIDQFNEFAEPDEGTTADSNDDAEPTRQWGYSALRAIRAEIDLYRRP